MPIKTFTRFAAMWILTNPPWDCMAMESFGLADHTVSDWFSFVDKFAFIYVKQILFGRDDLHPQMEIQMRQLVVRILDLRRLLKIYTKIIHDSSTRSNQIITVFSCDEWIEPSSTTRRLDERGFTHLCVSHSVNFVALYAGACANGIERRSRCGQSQIPRYGTKQYMLMDI
ncbi:hypothetical protein RF11_11156 [Thelohanellus kitauei]|uniref:Uncharacterized protein n=1 Tax=Thelohanellus kitauei TaxID=669202 RepID=A0A0C2NFK7_THEKT|nr:hypothetical protein RF11_11156 [Thelohanellus kitauei]